jgi:hypothetical protein
MKTVLVLYLFCSILSSNLQAGPIYASRWTNGTQDIRLYGDRFDTHTLLDGQDIIMADRFCTIAKDLPQDYVFLLEQINAPQLNDNSCYTEHIKIDENSGFLLRIQHKLTEMGFSDRIKTLDIHTHMLFIHILNIYYYYIQDAPDELSTNLFLSAIDYQWPGIIEKPFFEILQDAINQLHNLADRCQRADVNRIINTTKTLMILRKQHIFEFLKKNLFMDQEEQCLLSISTIISNLSFENFKANRKKYNTYAKLYKLFDFQSTPLSNYFNDLIHAQLLFLITGNDNVPQNIAVVAQDYHIEQLERSLFNLGYKQINGIGFEQRIAHNNAKNNLYEKLITSDDLRQSFNTCGVFALNTYYSLNRELYPVDAITASENLQQLQHKDCVELVPQYSLDWLK